MSRYIHRSPYFFGKKISDYGLEGGYVDYNTLASAFDTVLNNDILDLTSGVIGEWESIGGDDYYYGNSEGDVISPEEYEELPADEQEDWHENCYEIFQWWIIPERGADILRGLSDEIVYYNEELDMYLWGITHYGTSWDHVLTNIKIELEDEE